MGLSRDAGGNKIKLAIILKRDRIKFMHIQGFLYIVGLTLI